jgi:glycosyltransferase involved in cell wall biosynthesis
MAIEADVALFDGPEVLEYMVHRARKGLLSFEVGERWLKKGLLNLLSPRLLLNQLYYHTLFYKTPTYRLCASAFAAEDQYRMFSYRNRCYKWGYFVDTASNERSQTAAEPVRLMWCARFISWKHPEMVVECANQLASLGYDFRLDMYGDGPLRQSIEQQIIELKLTDRVTLHGNVENSKIRQAMQESDIFLFTSDRQEGWGVVANEAMISGCCLVGSDEIGAVPYLIKDGVSGAIFRSGDIESLVTKVKYLIDNPLILQQLASQGQHDIIDVWSPKRAAESFLQLVDDLIAGRDTSIQEGPCSKA